MRVVYIELDKITYHENDEYPFKFKSSLVEEGKQLEAKKIISSELYDKLFSHINNKSNEFSVIK